MIELLIINSLLIWGVYASLQEGFIYGWIGDWIRGKYDLNTITSIKSPIGYHLPSWIKKPLATCPVCMSSVYGTPIFLFAHLTGLINFEFYIFVYICYIFALAGLQYLILMFMPE